MSGAGWAKQRAARVRCGCVQTGDVLDTTGCALHPVECEALHPQTGVNCQHAPGHTGSHSYLATWPNTPADTTCRTCDGAGELTECANDGPAGCSHVDDTTWTCEDCRGTGEVLA